jgi:hypothetical protein
MRVRWTPEGAAAAVNGLLVLLVPMGLAAYLSSFGTAVRPPGWPQVRAWLQVLIGSGVAALPFAVLCAWRTFVHARTRRRGQASGWSGVLEGGACGFAVALLVLAPGIVLRPLDAKPYVVVYGGAATVIGLAIGFVLRLVALGVLALAPSRDSARPGDRLC